MSQTASAPGEAPPRGQTSGLARTRRPRGTGSRWGTSA